MKQQINDWYTELETNEQRIVVVAAIFFSLVILVFGILKPLNDSVSSLQGQVKSRQKSVDKWKQSMPIILANRGHSQGASSGQALSFIVTSTSKRFNLRVSRVQEKSSDEMQVWFDSVPFNDFIRWVAEVQNRHNVKVASVNVRSKDRDGLASIDIKILKT